MNSKLKIETRVRSLKNYLDEFETGAFQIPSFQRDFLWSQDDVKQLFDSIKNSYPVGSILFWKPLENNSTWINQEDSYIGPYRIIKQKTQDPVYILDGYQRLSSLFGCLTNPHKYDEQNLELIKNKWIEKFNLFYDLDEEAFVFLRRNSNGLPHQVPVYVFMNSIDFRKYAREEFDKIGDETRIEKYYDRADAMGQIFSNYQIASVDITQAGIEEAVEIFRRVNEKGLPISKDWIVSALTNDGDFRLGSVIDDLLGELKQYRFHNIKRDVIFQCIQNSFGRIYFDYKIEELVTRNDFREVTIRTVESIKTAVKFLFEDLLVLNAKLLPYNSQLVFLSSFFLENNIESLNDERLLELKKWFWVTTYSNYFTIYSLSEQRKAFYQFMKFTRSEDSNAIYNDKNDRFSTLEFPPKIIRGSVRAKALTLFMINYRFGITTLSTQRPTFDIIESLVDGKLFPIGQKENPSENFVPIVNIKNDGKSVFNERSMINEFIESPDPKFFISHDMLNKFHRDEYRNSNDFLNDRRKLIMENESVFVRSLGVDYYDDNFFML